MRYTKLGLVAAAIMLPGIMSVAAFTKRQPAPSTECVETAAEVDAMLGGYCITVAPTAPTVAVPQPAASTLYVPAQQSNQATRIEAQPEAF